MKLRTDVVEKLDPATCVDAARWFTRYELFVDIAEGKAEDDENRSTSYLRFLPLYLAGDALLCYEEMNEEVLGCYSSVKAQLSEYFRMDEATAYNSFCTAKFEPGNSVDAFVAQLRKYASLLDLGKHTSDKLILAQFMQAIPQDAAADIRGRCGRDNDALQLDVVLKVARHLPSLNNPVPIAGVTDKPTHGDSSQKRNENQKEPEREKSGGRSSAVNRRGGQQRRKLECYLCKEDHPMSMCPLIETFRQTMQGNAGGPAQA